ncbi:MAG: hypothetical protein K2N13_04960 [Paraprevotella sp.]|nr:hypothetical protein [Paraprevotella sp.]
MHPLPPDLGKVLARLPFSTGVTETYAEYTAVPGANCPQMKQQCFGRADLPNGG